MNPEAEDAESGAASDEETGNGADELADYGPPFTKRTFGGAFVWARAPGYVCTVLRVKPGENVVISTQNRCDMAVMLTGGRAVLEVHDAEGTDRVELVPAAPVSVDVTKSYRLQAVTEVELFTVYTPLPS